MHMECRTLAAALLWLCVSMMARSAPLKFVPQTLIQPNGDTIQVYASGDEFYHWVHDKDNYTIIRDPRTGYCVYAALENNRLVPSRYVVGKSDPAACGLEKGVNVFPNVARNLALGKRVDPSQASNPVVGTRYNLVVFIRFSDDSEFTGTISGYDSTLNLESGPSLKHYYHEVSHDRLDVKSLFVQAAGNSIVSFQDDKPRNYYIPYDSVTNPIGYRSDSEAREDTLLLKALRSVLPRIPSTLTLDGDGDGKVDNVTFIVSGNHRVWNDLLWPHMGWLLTSPAFLINGKTVYTYNFQLQQWFDVSVLCHEFGHSLGLPDLYHYYEARLTNSPLGQWDIMCSGIATHMSNYLKYAYLKWIPVLPEITTSGTYWINVSTSTANTMYKIASPRGGREWFLVEYRKKSGMYESGIPGTGLIVYRINEKVGGNRYGPPDEVYIYRPDGTLDKEGEISCACYSSESKRTAINDLTNPSSFRTDGQPGGLNISNIGSAGGDSIRFDVQILSAPAIPVTNDYAAMKVPFEWIDITKTGTEIHNWVNGPATPDAALDDGYSASAIPLGFSFPFYGQRFDSLYVGINGLVSFTQRVLNLSYSGNPTAAEEGHFNLYVLWPGNVVFPNSIAAAYQNFDLNRKDGYGGGGVFYKTDGDRFVLSWNGVGSTANKHDTTNSFQLVLNRETGAITINYLKFGAEAVRSIVKVGMEKDLTHGLEWIQSGDYPDHLPVNESSVSFVPNGMTTVRVSGHDAREFTLEQNYPNPFNPSTTISFRLPTRAHIDLRIFDVLGRETATIASEDLPAGTYSRLWDASGLPSGVYFYRLQAGAYAETKRLIILR